jgi:hypothetical protein
VGTYIRQTVSIDGADGPFDPPEPGYVLDEVVEGHRKLVLIWVDGDYLREQTQGSMEVEMSSAGELEQARELADLVGAEVEK